MIHGAETLPGSCLEGSASMAFKSAASQARPPRSRRAQSQRRTPRRLAPQPRDAHTAPSDRHPPALAQRLRASPWSFVPSVVNLADQATLTDPPRTHMTPQHILPTNRPYATILNITARVTDPMANFRISPSTVGNENVSARAAGTQDMSNAGTNAVL